MEQVLVIAEHDGVELAPVTRDLLAWGAQAAAAIGGKLGVVLAGAGVERMAQSLVEAADTLYLLDDAALATYHPIVYVRGILAALVKDKPRLILLGHTYFGIEVSSGLAAGLDANLWSNCRNLEYKDGAYEVMRPVFGGGYESTITISAQSCNVMTMQRGSAPVASPAAVRAAATAHLSLPANATDTGIKVVGETKATFEQDITQADLLVAVGRGIGQQDRLDTYRELASALGGSIAASRPLVDLGWLPVDFQVGLSGRTVQPKVYLACGISGSMQHLAGMRESKLIIAINQDADAPIFQFAHYGVVADINAIVPALTEQAKSTFGKN